jgi:dienelactone hydrolase
VALVLHGGRENSQSVTRARQLAVLRMLPFATALHGTPGLAVARLRFRVRGWNGDLRSPVTDARWALDELARRFPGAPVALVGHSMGGRTAIHVAGAPDVRVAVLLAPWIERDDPSGTMAGRRLLIVHGAGDRVTDPRRSAAYARAAVGVAETVGYVTVRGDKHAMLRRAPLWHRITAGFVRGALLGREPSDGSDTADVVVKALAGSTDIVV